MRTVTVFLDYQNVYHRARDAFCSRAASASEGQVDPLALGLLLTERVPNRRLVGVRLYRGRPSGPRDPRSYAAFRRQSAAQLSAGRGLVTVVARSLRYPPGWPQQPAQEKGIDVALAVDLVMMVARDECDIAIVFSSDTDLLPALEAVIALKPGDPLCCEVAAWAGPGMRPRALAVRGVRLRQHLLGPDDFRAVADVNDYARAR